MAFGQPAGPPAGTRQLEQLAQLFERAGYATFREARHPFGLNQRQAAGRFTVSEADDLIERLEAAEAVRSGDDPGVAAPHRAMTSATPAVQDVPVAPDATAAGRRAGRARRKVEVLSAFDDYLLVEELERRGWCCIPPISGLDEV